MFAALLYQSIYLRREYFGNIVIVESNAFTYYKCVKYNGVWIIYIHTYGRMNYGRSTSRNNERETYRTDHQDPYDHAMVFEQYQWIRVHIIWCMLLFASGTLIQDPSENLLIYWNDQKNWSRDISKKKLRFIYIHICMCLWGCICVTCCVKTPGIKRTK